MDKLGLEPWVKNEELDVEVINSKNLRNLQDSRGMYSALLILPHPSFLDELPQAEGLGASEAAERLGQDCMWDVAGEDGHRWRVFRTGQREQRVDMTVIEPYKKVLSHGGNGGVRAVTS